jgi:hypothetical protein
LGIGEAAKLEKYHPVVHQRSLASTLNASVYHVKPVCFRFTWTVFLAKRVSQDFTAEVFGQSGSYQNLPVTESLLAQLTYLPLTIVQAAAYINENRITLADYL